LPLAPPTAPLLGRKLQQPLRLQPLQHLFAGSTLQLSRSSDPAPVLTERERQLAPAQAAAHSNQLLGPAYLFRTHEPAARTQDCRQIVHHVPYVVAANDSDVSLLSHIGFVGFVLFLR
jgi:hypothetical protein